jgi:alkylated DNA repair dioxygenase AlkB
MHLPWSDPQIRRAIAPSTVKQVNHVTHATRTTPPTFFRFPSSYIKRRTHPDFERTAGLPEQLDFLADTLWPEGLRYAANFVSPAVEQKLIAHIAALPLQPFQFGPYEGKRRVASFGFRYDYALRSLQQADPIPEWLDPLIANVEACGGPETRIRQILCTEYLPGVGIGWHRDKPHFDRVFGLSLGSACKFRFRRRAGEKWDRFTLDAQPRSIYMMTGPSRLAWEHSIPAVEAPRYSITFRTMLDKPRPPNSFI